MMRIFFKCKSRKNKYKMVLRDIKDKINKGSKQYKLLKNNYKNLLYQYKLKSQRWKNRKEFSLNRF